MHIRHLSEADYRRMRWKNGGGWTTELACAASADASGDFAWRISIAEIESDGAFSTFPQCDRFIALLDGNGMRLDFDAAPSASLEQRLRFVRFSGDWKTFGTLLVGPVRDFNVIARRDAFQVETLHRPLLGPMLFPAETAVTWFIHLVAGSAQIRFGDTRIAVSAGESLLLDPDTSRAHAVLDGCGELVLVKLTSQHQANEELDAALSADGIIDEREDAR